MPLLLVRHAVALRRRDWSQADHLRHLTPKGYSQARALVDVLADFEVERILSSPFVRCVETVEPLASRLELPVEVLPALAEGGGDAAAGLELDGGTATIVLCSHGDVIPELLDALAPDQAADGRGLPCAKGSTWVIERVAGSQPSARYLDPPDVR